MQEDQNDCGAACLSMIIEYYHGYIPYQQIKDGLGNYKNGITAYQLIEYSKTLGFDSKGIECNLSTLNGEGIILPCIAHVLLEKAFYHYVVVYEINVKKHTLVIGDPSKGICQISFEKFDSIWDHIILTFLPKVPISYIEPNTILKDHLLYTIKKEKKTFTILLVLAIFITFFAIMHTTMLNHFVSILDSHDRKMYLLLSVLLYSFFIILKIGGGYLRNKLFLHVYQKIDFQLMSLIFDQILHLPYRYYKNRTTGEMMSRIQDIGIIRSFLGNIVLSSLMDFPLLIISGICLYVIHNQLFVIALVTVILYFILFFWYQKIISKKIEQVEEENAKINSYIVETISGYESVFGSHLTSDLKNRFSTKYIHYSEHIKELEIVENQKQIMSQLLFEGSILTILGVGIWLISNHYISVSVLLLFHSLFLYFVDPIKNLLRIGEEAKKVKIAWKRLSNLFYETKDIGVYQKKMNGEIRFKNVSFSYFFDKPVLKKLNFHIHAGKKVLITGTSGTGKSTILKLLMKYYEQTSGTIEIDDINIKDYKQEALEQNIIYVSMKEQLFTGPLCQNISLSEKYDSSYQNILKITETDEIIQKNKLGHYMMIEENGANLSGGEKQRVILARTLLLPFEILLLDEATSQIDVNMERRILKRIFEQFPNKTILMVSHRTDNADLFDQWIEISNGMVKKDVKKYG